MTTLDPDIEALRLMWAMLLEDNPQQIAKLIAKIEKAERETHRKPANDA